MKAFPYFFQLFSQFNTQGRLVEVSPFGSGHINDTFLLTTQSEKTPNYIAQRINHHVFTDIPRLMANITYVTEHMKQRLIERNDPTPEKHAMTVVKASDGCAYYQDNQGSYWSFYVFIEGQSFDLVETPYMAYQGGKIYGQFLDLVSDIDSQKIHTTIPKFHHIGHRLDQCQHALEEDRKKRRCQIKNEMAFIQDYQEPMQSLLQLGRAGKIPWRITHNDTKFNNILLDKNKQGLCVVDLDTVMPGFIHYDYSDAIRSTTNTAKEDEADLSKVDINLDLLKAFCQGFIGEIQTYVTETELYYLPQSTSLLPFMIGLRFLTDYLDGDRYYKTAYEQHNLIRARCQFQLVRQIEHKMPEIKAIIERIIDAKSSLKYAFV